MCSASHRFQLIIILLYKYVCCLDQMTISMRDAYRTWYRGHDFPLDFGTRKRRFLVCPIGGSANNEELHLADEPFKKDNIGMVQKRTIPDSEWAQMDHAGYSRKEDFRYTVEYVPSEQCWACTCPNFNSDVYAGQGRRYCCKHINAAADWAAARAGEPMRLPWTMEQKEIVLDHDVVWQGTGRQPFVRFTSGSVFKSCGIGALVEEINIATFLQYNSP